MVQNVTRAGVFAVGEKLATLGTQMGLPVTDPFFPHAAALVGQGDRAKLGEAARTGSRVSAGVTIPCCLVVAVLARPALVAWVGPVFDRAAPAVVILALAFALQSFGAAPRKLLSGSGGQRLVATLGLARVGVQILLTAVLGSAFGVTGVAWAILTSVVVVEMAVALPMVCRRLGISPGQVVWPVVRAHAPALLVGGGVGWFVLRPPVSAFAAGHGRLPAMAMVGVAGVAVLCVYLIVFFVSGLDRGGRRRAIGRVRAVRRDGARALDRPESPEVGPAPSSGNTAVRVAPLMFWTAVSRSGSTEDEPVMASGGMGPSR